MRHHLAIAVVCAVIVQVSAAGDAAVIHRTVHVFEDSNGQETRDGARIEGATSADINADIFAGINGLGFRAFGSVGRFGSLGVSGAQFTGGEMISQVIISSDEFVNVTGLEQRGQANFIIDGGSLFLDAAPGATLSLQLDVSSRVVAGGQTFSRERFQAGIDLIIPPGSFQPATFRPFSSDIGATYDGNGRVDIPISFQSLDIGIIPAGARVELEYFLDIRTDVPRFAEGLFFEFSDPLNVATRPSQFPTVQLSSRNSPVPEPSSFLVFGSLCVLGLAWHQINARRKQAFGLRPENEHACKSA